MKASSIQDTPAAWLATPIMVCSLALAACGASDNGSALPNDAPVPAIPAEPTLTFHSIKTFRFHWSDIADATHYRLMENPDGMSGFTQVANDITQGTEHIDHIVPLYARTNAQYILQSCVENGCIDSDVMNVSGTMVGSIGYIKAGNTSKHDRFGGSVYLSADGSTLAVGASAEDSNATGVNGSQNDISANQSGAVYVFIRNGSLWDQQAYIKASNTHEGDRFGSSVSLSTDGHTLAIGAFSESSSSTGVNGNQNDTSAGGSGAAYVFTRSGGEWSQQAYIKASNTDATDFFGGSVSLSADGSTLAVGATGEDSNTTGINGNQSDNSANDWSGAVYMFTRSGIEWSQQAYIKASNTDADEYFGASVSLSADGTSLAVGSVGEDSSATGVNGDQSDNSAEGAGAVYVFMQIDDTWSQQAYIKASNTDSGDGFGGSVELSADGETLAVGAQDEDSNAIGVSSDQSDNSTCCSGAVYVFTRSGSQWYQKAYVKASNTDKWDQFGTSVSLSADGNILAVGATDERSNAIGVNGNQNDNSKRYASGAVYMYTLDSGEWTQLAYLKASNIDAGDYFGGSISLSTDGATLAVGATGANTDDSVEQSGAAYLF